MPYEPEYSLPWKWPYRGNGWRQRRRRSLVMAKPRKRLDTVNSLYFEKVTPLWVGPGKTPVPERFHAASLSLADWAGPNWSDNDATGFFPLRHYLIAACERWHSYDWKADEELLATWKQDAKHRETIARATRAFRFAISNSAFRKAERDLGISVAAALCPNAQIDMTYEDGCNAVREALRKFEGRALSPDRSPARFGPLLYTTSPRKLPSAEIAIALVLADLLTGFRRDKHRAGSVLFPRAPLLSPKLPWKAITQFATAFSDDPQAKFDHRKVASSVKNLHGKVTRILRFP